MNTFMTDNCCLVNGMTSSGAQNARDVMLSYFSVSPVDDVIAVEVISALLSLNIIIVQFFVY